VIRDRVRQKKTRPVSVSLTVVQGWDHGLDGLDGLVIRPQGPMLDDRDEAWYGAAKTDQRGIARGNGTRVEQEISDEDEKEDEEEDRSKHTKSSTSLRL
jgi:hypothetical protein